MITIVRERILEFIDYLRSTEEYKTVLERFKEYLKTTAKTDRTHMIVFDFDNMDYDFGEWLDIQDRDSNLIKLTDGYYFNSKITIEKKEYDTLSNMTTKKCMICPKESVFEGYDINEGNIIFCQEHLDEWNMRKTGGMKWDEVSDD